jgi:hypothetical protein
LGDEFAFKGLFEDALAEGFGFLQVFDNGDFEAITNGKAGFNFFYDSFLFFVGAIRD